MTGTSIPTNPHEPGRSEFAQVVKDLVSLNESIPSVSVGRANQERLLVLHGLVAHTLNCADTAVMVIEQGRHHAAKPLVRVALEHAIVAQWVHQHPEGIDAFLSKANKSYRTYYRSASKVVQIPKDVQASFDAMPDPGEIPSAVSNFEQTCRVFDPSGNLYLVYRTLSGAVHPGNATLRDYLQGDPYTNEDLALLTYPEERDTRPDLWAAALAAVLASAVYEDIRRGKPLKAKVCDIADRVGIPTKLELTPVDD